MLDWQNANEEEQRLQSVFKLIFQNHSKLLDILFEPQIPRLKKEPKNILDEIGPLSKGEKVLIQVALDLWDGSGKVLFWDVVHYLDSRSQKAVFVGLEYLKIIPDVGALGLSTIKNGAPKALHGTF